MSVSVEHLLKRILPHLKVERGPLPDGRYVAWCPFHPDGQGKPPHEPNLHVWPQGFLCHACGRKGPLRQLAQHLGILDRPCLPMGSERGTADTMVATYDYHDEQGNLLFQVVRKEGKRFYQRRPDGKGGWINNLDGVRRVLYRLPELSSRPSEPVFAVEGEKDVEALQERGLLATTNPGGAGKWRPEYSQTLKGREVVILPDNDDPGRRHADQVARCLTGLARSTKVLPLPGLPKKGDVSDWLAGEHTVGELLDLVGGAAVWRQSDTGVEKDADDQRKSEPQAVELVRRVQDEGAELFRDERGEPFAAVPLPEGRRIFPLRSQDFHRWLSHLAWMKMGKALSGEVLASAQRVLEGIARFEGTRYQLDVRCAWHEGSIWLDLDGVRAVQIEPGRWAVVAKPPILFRSFPHQHPLPEPARGGDLRRVLNFVNLSGEDSRLLMLCYLVAAMVSGVPVPPLIVHGVQGAAKTTLLKVVKRLLDPSAVEVRGGVRDLAEYAQAACQNRVLFFDNLTTVPLWLSDALCRTVTGEGYSKRALYTDEGTVVFEYQRVVGLSGINLVADRADLLDRSVILELEPIAPNRRQEEKVFWGEFEKARSSILGGLLDALSAAMRIAPGLKLLQLPRMADFARWGAAAAEALGAKGKDFLAAYQCNVGRQNEAAIEGNPVAQAVLAFMEGVGSYEWQGTPTGLMQELKGVAESKGLDTKAKNWPKSVTWLSRRLREVLPNLQAMGIDVVDDRTPNQRLITLRRIIEDREAGSPGNTRPVTEWTTGQENADTLRDGVSQENDGRDSNDSIPDCPW